MGDKKPKQDWKEVKFNMNQWIYTERLERWANDNGMSVAAAIRFIINQFFKDKHY